MLTITHEDGSIDCYIFMGCCKFESRHKKMLDMEDGLTMFLSDSSAVLHSLKAELQAFSIAFQNRLAQIHRHLSILGWREIRSIQDHST